MFRHQITLSVQTLQARKTQTELPFNALRQHSFEWVGPSWAQVVPSWAQARNFGPKEMQKIKILKIQIRSAQNVGKVWISRKKILLALFHIISGNFLREPEKSKKKNRFFVYFPWWAHGPCSPGLGPSTGADGRWGGQVPRPESGLPSI